MQNAFLSAILIFSFTATAQAGEINYVGQFSMPHKTVVFGYDDEKSCAADKGEWISEDQMCLFEVSDDVKVEQTSDGGLKMNVETIGGNAHSCGFEAAAVEKTTGLLIGSVETEIYRYNENTKETEVEKAICEVSVSYKDSDTVSVSNNGNCNEFCGARAQLYIDDAKRVAPKAE